jgi:adenylate kinase
MPGAGKGTQTERILQKHPHILPFSSGNILRSHITQKTPLGIRIEAILAEGGLVPDHLVTYV